MEREMWQYLEWELNIDPVMLKGFDHALLFYPFGESPTIHCHFPSTPCTIISASRQLHFTLTLKGRVGPESTLFHLVSIISGYGTYIYSFMDNLADWPALHRTRSPRRWQVLAWVLLVCTVITSQCLLSSTLPFRWYLSWDYLGGESRPSILSWSGSKMLAGSVSILFVQWFGTECD